MLLAIRMREMGEQMRNATVEMWGRLWQVDTLFETGQLATVPSALIDLSSCVERVHRPEARWHLLEYSAVAAHAAGRYEDAIRLAGQAFEVMRHMGHPLAVGGYAVVLGQVGMHIGFGASGQAELYASPILIKFSKAITDMDRFAARLFSSREPFRLWGSPVRAGTDHIVVDAVDLHVGHTLRIDLGPEWMRVLLFQHTCGNSFARLVSNLQRHFDAALSIADEELQTSFSGPT